MLKDIKNVHLSVYPPTGRVRISAPLRMSLDTIRVFAISKLGWIRQQQKKLASRSAKRRAVLRPGKPLRVGKRYLLKVVEEGRPPRGSSFGTAGWSSRCRPEVADGAERSLSTAWYRAQIKRAVPPLFMKWEPANRR